MNEGEEKQKRKRIRKRKVVSEEDKLRKKSARKEATETSSSTPASADGQSVPPEAANLVNDRTVYIEGIPFSCEDADIRKFFNQVKTGNVVRFDHTSLVRYSSHCD